LALESEPCDIETFIPNTVKDKYAYWNKIKTAYRIRLLKDYDLFLRMMLKEVFDITKRPEYWKMREENIRNSNITQCEPSEAPDVKSLPRIVPSIQDLIEKKQVDPNPVGDKYRPRKGMHDFISWCMSYSGFAEDFTPEFFYENFFHRCKLSTIERYFSDAKEEKR
jgi:hypothetical protein